MPLWKISPFLYTLIRLPVAEEAVDEVFEVPLVDGLGLPAFAFFVPAFFLTFLIGFSSTMNSSGVNANEFCNICEFWNSV